jgi:hypothetical protein
MDLTYSFLNLNGIDKLPKPSVTKYGMTGRYEWEGNGRDLFKADM